MAKRAPPSGNKFPPQKKGPSKKQTLPRQQPKSIPPVQQSPVAPQMQSTTAMGAALPPNLAPKRGIY